MIKASSLYYAIMICLLVGISCASFLMVSYYSKMHASVLETQTALLHTNTSAINYFLTTIDEMEIESSPKEIDVFENGIVSKGHISQWGFYKTLQVTSHFKNDTVTRQVLLGSKNKSETALYLADSDKPLQMVGRAKITGDVYLPKKGIKKGYLRSQSYSTFMFLNGKKHTSRNTLPDLKGVFKKNTALNEKARPMEEIKDGEVIYNPFDRPALKINVDASNFNRKNIQGHVIISATDSLYIKKGNLLEDVMIIAPKVVFERGFKGTVQVMADESVILENDVVLKYPSGVFMKNTDAEKVEVIVEEDAKLLGSIVVTAALAENKGTSLVSFHKNAELIGTLYTKGNTQLKGKVTGSVFTNGFYLKTKAATYENYIEDGVIDSESLPDFFLGSIFVLNQNNQQRYGIIKTL